MCEYKTTAAQFRLFKKTFNEYVRKFGMLEWDISFQWTASGETEDGAKIEHDSIYKCATVTLNRTWPTPVTDKLIRRAAVHEFAHMLTSDMEYLINSRNVSTDSITEKRESLARRFENFFYPDNQ